jgi:hypothetical protein
MPEARDIQSTARQYGDSLFGARHSPLVDEFWSRVAGWMARFILMLLIAVEAENWLDILMFQSEEYERLIGSEAGCGVAKSYCSWPAFLLDDSPFVALSVPSMIALLWRGLPRRESALRALAALICGFLAWKAYSVHLKATGQAAATIENSIIG